MVLSVAIGSMSRSAPGGPRAKNAIRLFMLLPLIVPGVVQGLALLPDLGGPAPHQHIPGYHYPVHDHRHAVRLHRGVCGLANVDPRLEMASRSFGAGNTQTLWWVLVPMVFSGILSGALFACVHSFDELIIVIFITTLGIDTLPKMMWNSIEHGRRLCRSPSWHPDLCAALGGMAPALNG